MVYTLQVFPHHLDQQQISQQPVPLTTARVLRRCNGPGVTRHEVRHGRARGTIFRPPGPGPFRGVVDIYGGSGGINESRVAMLASRGFIGFTLPHHKYDDLPRNLVDVELEYIVEALRYFASLPDVQPNIGVLCVCAGGAIGLFVSTICPLVSAVITFGSPYGFTDPLWYFGERTTHLKHIMESAQDSVTVDKHGGFYLEEFINNHTPDDIIAIPIEKSDAKFLIVAGSDDKSMCAVRSGRYLVERMSKYGKGDCITLLEYPGAGHFIDPPYMPKTLLQYYPEHKFCAAVGGTASENSLASLHCWRETLSFLNKNVGVKSKM